MTNGNNVERPLKSTVRYVTNGLQSDGASYESCFLPTPHAKDMTCLTVSISVVSKVQEERRSSRGGGGERKRHVSDGFKV